MDLYKLSFPNGKLYIGITSKTARQRFKEHCNNTKYPVNHAIKKYGKENVKLTVLATVDNWELLYLAEQEAIEKFNTKSPNGYNLTDGGIGVLGRKHSEESKKKMSESSKGIYPSPETRAKLSAIQKKRIFTDEHRMKISKAKKGKPIHQNTIDAVIWAQTGRKHSIEHREKIALATIGKKRTVEQKREKDDG